MQTSHKLIFDDSEDMTEVEGRSVHLVVTSLPCFNAPFDYPELFDSYEAYLEKMRKVAKEIKRVIAHGRVGVSYAMTH